MRRVLAIGVVGALIGFGAGAATAAEIIAVTPQINPRTDEAGVIDATVIVEDEAGGFTAGWSRARSRFQSATELFARSYGADLRPKNGPGKPFHAPIDSIDPTAVRMAGGFRLVRDKALFGWEALFVNASSPHNPEFVVRTLKNDKPKDAPVAIDNTPGFISGSRLIPLAGGRALAYWGQGNIMQAWGRLFEHDGAPSPTFLSIATSGYWFVRPGIFPLDRGFAAFFANHTDDGDEIFIQVYDENGAPDGAPFSIIPGDQPFETMGGVGLADGRIAILRYVDQSSSGYVSAWVFNRAGRTVTPETRILKNVTFNNALPMVALPDGDFLVALDDADATGARVRVARFNSRLKPIGAVAATAREPGLRRSALRLLSDGNAAVGYVVDNQRVHVAIVKP